MTRAHVEPFYDKATSTFSYVVYGKDDRQCAIIDSVLDYDPKASRTSTESAEAIVRYVRQQGLQVQWILETHAHADHITAAPYLKEQLGGQIAIGAPIVQVQRLFKKLYNLGSDLETDGSQFDRLFEDGASFQVGSLPVTVHHCPGHTCADMVYDFEGVGMFIGDTLFQPDYGTARCDFPGGDARSLYRSIRWIL